MLLRDLVIMVILAAALVTGTGVIIGEFNSAYVGDNSTISTNFSSKYQSELLAEQQNVKVNLEGSINSNTTTPKQASDITTILSGSWGAVNGAFNSMVRMGNLITDFGQRLGFDSWFTGAILAIISTIIIFVVISAFLRGRL